MVGGDEPFVPVAVVAVVPLPLAAVLIMDGLPLPGGGAVVPTGGGGPL